jgi:hypothetical protein
MKFNLRDLFWLVLASALAIGWWVDRGNLARRTWNAEVRAAAAELDLKIYKQRVSWPQE